MIALVVALLLLLIVFTLPGFIVGIFVVRWIWEQAQLLDEDALQ